MPSATPFDTSKPFGIRPAMDHALAHRVQAVLARPQAAACANQDWPNRLFHT